MLAVMTMPIKINDKENFCNFTLCINGRYKVQIGLTDNFNIKDGHSLTNS